MYLVNGSNQYLNQRHY